MLKQNLLQACYCLKLLMKTTKVWHLPESCCCICGMLCCRESSDHRALSLKEFKHLINTSKASNYELDQTKEKIKAYYKRLKEDVIFMIDQDSNKMNQRINQYYFSHLDPHSINLSQICEFASERFNKLPHKKIIKIVNALKNGKSKPYSFEDNLQFQQTKNQILSFITEFQKKKQKEKLKSFLPYHSIIQKQVPKLHLKRSQSDISNPEQKDEEATKTYSWKNVVVKARTKTLQLSNKNITDQQLIREMPILSSFKHIKDLQIRNNKITSLSCKIIASNMKHLKSIDIRGNAVGDQGIMTLIRGIPHLKSFMISETRCTNLSAVAIVNGLADLQTLWCEHNQINDEHAIMIGKMVKLKVLSFAGTGLDAQTGVILKKIFNSKGYVIV